MEYEPLGSDGISTPDRKMWFPELGNLEGKGGINGVSAGRNSETSVSDHQWNATESACDEVLDGLCVVSVEWGCGKCVGCPWWGYQWVW